MTDIVIKENPGMRLTRLHVLRKGRRIIEIDCKWEPEASK